MTASGRSGRTGCGTPRAPHADEARGGFTMVEVIVAIVILTVGVLGLAGTTGYIVRQVTLANVMTQRSVAQQTVIEKVQAMPFASLASGTESVGRYTVTWTSATETVQSKLVTIVTTGPGLQSSTANPFPMMADNVADTFVYRVVSR